MKDDFRPSATQPNSPEDRGELDLERRIEELENSLSIALDTNDEYQRENVALKKRAQEAEGEMTIVKGIGMNSPEMRACQVRVKELNDSLAIALDINDNFQRQSVAMRKRTEEVEEDNKRLSQQISDYIKKYEDSFRKAGL